MLRCKRLAWTDRRPCYSNLSSREDRGLKKGASEVGRMMTRFFAQLSRAGSDQLGQIFCVMGRRQTLAMTAIPNDDLPLSKHSAGVTADREGFNLREACRYPFLQIRRRPISYILVRLANDTG